MNSKALSLLVCVIIQTIHALPAIEAGMVVFNAHWINALAMAFMQILLGVIAFVYIKGVVKAKPVHRKKMSKLCDWAVAYLAFSIMAEVYIICFGSPFTHEITEFIAHTLMFIDGAASLYLWERLKPDSSKPLDSDPTKPPGRNPPTSPTLRSHRPPKPLPPRLKGPSKKSRSRTRH